MTDETNTNNEPVNETQPAVEQEAPQAQPETEAAPTITQTEADAIVAEQGTRTNETVIADPEPEAADATTTEEPTKLSEGEAPTGTSSAEDVTQSAPVEEVAATNTAPPVETITVTFKGGVNSVTKVPKGSTVAEALKLAGHPKDTMTRKANNDVLFKTAILNEDTTITTVAKAIGG